jgi:DnaJ like chaperone protein
MGKAVGGLLGLAVGSAPGALIGVALGQAVDSGIERLSRDLGLPFGDRRRIEGAFFTVTFSVMGHLAKADGRVSEAEIALAERIMARLQLSGERRAAAIALFRQGKAPDFQLGAAVGRFRRECLGRRMLVQLFLEFQLQAAYAEGEPSAAKRRVLEQIRVGLGISPMLFAQLENLVRMQRRFTDGPAGRRGYEGAGARSLGRALGRRRWLTRRGPTRRAGGTDPQGCLLPARRRPQGFGRRGQAGLPQTLEPTPSG